MRNAKLICSKGITLLLLCVLYFCSNSCGYRVGYHSLFNEQETLAIPYVEGDIDGSLTAAIVHQFAQNSNINYSPEGGSLLLKIKIVADKDENIGFRYDRTKKGERTDTLIPAETRLIQIVEVCLIEAASGKVILPPVQLSAWIECDHDYNTVRRGVNIFSLGQLTVSTEAFEAAQQSLHRLIAQKIVDYINYGW